MTKRRSKKSQAAKKAKPKETKVEFLASLAGVLATGLFIMIFMVQGFAIPSGSMENTLLVGDHVFVNRIQYAPPTSWARSLIPYDQIHRGDIVVFLSPQTPGLPVVKRVIGVPGDRIHLRNGVVYEMVRSWTNHMFCMTPANPSMRTETIFRLLPLRHPTSISGMCGVLVSPRLLTARTSLSHQTATLEWAITGV